ncbi:hypothetical protein RRG08_061955 [Elysia crispata]|uniref:Uncharacterized protein n=1 Tax=Elysia crispata TaxID=231223 RepID=A0AAE1DHT6_9GAST|nr:hypothetical protein RRG08_061955 [Elysia crispata]
MPALLMRDTVRVYHAGNQFWTLLINSSTGRNALIMTGIVSQPTVITNYDGDSFTTNAHHRLWRGLLQPTVITDYDGDSVTTNAHHRLWRG